jgi:AcrR family transcriptional regulator
MAARKPNQKQRLKEAMIVTAARYGYREASVARVVSQAGVSRATFYEHFEDKEACFLAAYRVVARRIAEELRIVDENPQTAGRPRQALKRLLDGADREPASARIALLEALAAGPAVRAEYEKLFSAMVDVMDTYLDQASTGDTRLEIPARSLVGGLGSVVAIRVLRGEAGRLVDLLDDLEAWTRAHELSRGKRRNQAGWEAVGAGLWGPVEPAPSTLETRLPRGRAALGPVVVAGEQRQRALAAVAHLARKGGYATMTVAEIVATASISREAFYEHFRNKEDAFLAAQAHALETSVSVAAGAFFSDKDWPDRIWNALAALLRYFASVPDFAALDVVESYTVGPAAIRRSFETRMAFTLFLEDGYRQRPEAERLPRLCSEAVAGGILELMRRQAVKGRIAFAMELIPQAAYMALAPFIGPTAALDLIERRCGSG